MLSALIGIVFLCLCVQAAVKDVLTLTIPNWMNAGLALLFIPAAFAAGIGWSTAGEHLLVGLAAFVVSFGLFSFRVFGGGDAKMIPAVLLWIGPSGFVTFLFGMALVGGLFGFVLLAGRRAVPVDIAPGFAREILHPENGMPYGVAIAAGVFLAAGKSPLLIEVLQRFNPGG